MGSNELTEVFMEVEQVPTQSTILVVDDDPGDFGDVGVTMRPLVWDSV